MGLSVLLIITLLVGGCAKTRGAYQVINYVNQGILHINAVENKAIERYRGSIGIGEAALQRELETLKTEVLPTYKRFRRLLQQVETPTEEIRAVHALYLHAAELYYSGFKTKMAGLERKDDSLIHAGNDEIAKGSLKLAEWREALNGLYDKYGVVHQ